MKSHDDEESLASWYLFSTDASAARPCSIVSSATEKEVFQNKPVSGSKSEILKWDLLFFIVAQEEEIPELEIDIDELLELTDEGQRSRLQVSEGKKMIASCTCCSFSEVNPAISNFHPPTSHTNHLIDDYQTIIWPLCSF